MSLPAIPPAPAPVAGSFAKEFRCTWGSCTKSFSRAEHLHRHALNHNENNGTTCTRCSAVFKRKDLLDRHMTRHKEKDEEAGGDGLGKLLTRKRLWRDATGAIVAKRRPEHEKKRKRPSPSQNESSSISDPAGPNILSNRIGAPLSPPVSDPTGSEINGNSGLIVSVAPEEPWPMSLDDMVVPDQGVVESFDYLCNGSWGLQSLQNGWGTGGIDMPSDDMLIPDNGSFNMPVTTTSYYNWLFGTETWQTSTFNSGPATQTAYPRSLKPTARISNISSLLSGSDDSFPRTVPQIRHDPFRAGLPSIHPDLRSSSDIPENQDHDISKSAELLVMLQSGDSHLNRSITDYRDGSVSDVSTGYTNGLPPIRSYFLPPPISARSGQDVLSNFNIPRSSRRMPFVDEVAREAVLSLIAQAHPKLPDGSDISRNHPLLAISKLRQWCDLFFARFNIPHPLLHQATFDPLNTDPLLLTSVLLLGATYSNTEDHAFSICIHNVMRSQILASQAFTTRPSLSILQAILLVECFGKLRAGQLEHDMSHIFHGLLVNLIRRSEFQSAKSWSFREGEATLDQRWQAEIEVEQKRRLVLLCFMWDTQHSVLFSQSPCMNAVELKLSLPWDSTLWEADTAEEWQARSSRTQPPLQFLSVLKTYINPNVGPPTAYLNAFSRVVILHGLMAVAWDLNRRDQTSLGTAVLGRDEVWQSRLSRSYDAWRADFDTYTRDTLQALEDYPPEKEEFQRYSTANLAIYHIAHIILHVDPIDLQIYAGASHIIGRPVTATDRDRSKQRIERWAMNDPLSAATAASHAAHILRDGIRKLKNWDAGDVFHYPWCLYLATLTCWTFQVASQAGTSGENGANFGAADDDESDWDAGVEMNALIRALTRPNMEHLWRDAIKYRTTDLPKVMAKHLCMVRWAVVQEGMIVLRGLAGNGK